MTECKPVKTPLPRELNLSLMDFPDEINPESQSEYSGIVVSGHVLIQVFRDFNIQEIWLFVRRDFTDARIHLVLLRVT